MNLKNYLSLAFLTLICFCGSGSLQAQVVINEYSCSNIATIPDNYGNTPDWIELYNSSASTVSLNGYYLSDKISSPTKWTIPAGVSIAPSGFLRIWCSGKNIVVGTNIHAGFTLTQTKREALIF